MANKAVIIYTAIILFGLVLMAACKAIQLKEIPPYLTTVAREYADSARVISRNGGYGNEEDTYTINVKKGATELKNFLNKK